MIRLNAVTGQISSNSLDYFRLLMQRAVDSQPILRLTLRFELISCIFADSLFELPQKNLSERFSGERIQTQIMTVAE